MIPIGCKLTVSGQTFDEVRTRQLLQKNNGKMTLE